MQTPEPPESTAEGVDCEHPLGGFIVGLRALLRGYLEAVARFDAARLTWDPEPAFLALFEALNWAVTIDEGIAERWAPEGELLRWTWRARLPGAQSMAAVRFARNRVHHHWADALVLDLTGAELPTPLPAAFLEWRWRPLDELPEGRSDPPGEATYRSMLEKRPARVALHDLSSAFAYVAPLIDPPGPHSPRRAPP